MRVVGVRAEASDRIAQMARLLVESFREVAPDAWTTIEDGLARGRG